MTENNFQTNLNENAVRDFKNEIVSIVRGNHPAHELKSLLEDYHYNDVASALSLLNENERKRLYTVLDAETENGLATKEPKDGLDGLLGCSPEESVVNSFTAPNSYCIPFSNK